MGRVAAARVGAIPDDRSTPTDARLVRRLTSDHVAEHLRDSIFRGELAPGERVPQDEIAARLGVSRLPVREALQAMERDGLIVIEPHLGAFVAPFDADVVRDHFEIVGLVQGLAASRLAERGDNALLAQLHTVVEEIGRTRDRERVHELTLDFHRIINREGASSRQRSVLRALSRMLPTGFFLDIPGATESERTGVERIWKAIASGDSAGVRDTCLAVQQERGEMVVGMLRAQGVFDGLQADPVEADADADASGT
jgi:DNA-binding GntR family transcriptional regulator